MPTYPQIVEALPELARELEAFLAEQGESGLATQVCALKIVDRCRCGDDFCTTFHTLPKPEGS